MTRFAVLDDELVVEDMLLNSIGWFESMFWTSDSTLVGLTPFASFRAVRMNRQGHVVDSFAPVPASAPDIPPTVVYQMYEPAVAVAPDGNHLVLAARHAGRIDIYPTRGGVGVTARVPSPFEPVVNMRHNGAIWLYQIVGETRFGYIASAATNEHIYALFSGRTMRGCNQCAWFGDEVHVFTWDGEFVESIRLDRDLIAIAVSPDAETLYGAAWDPEPAIFEFDLVAFP